MMKLTKQQSNFTALKTTLILVTVIIAGYIGYLLYSNYKENSAQTVSTSAEDVRTAPAINEPTDLEEAASAIDETEVESNSIEDLNEIDKELSSF